jgi:hypothetical protein
VSKELDPCTKLVLLAGLGPLHTYNPPERAFVDMMDVVKIPYDSKFKKKGALTIASRKDIVKMHTPAVLQSSARQMNRAAFTMWLDKFRKLGKLYLCMVRLTIARAGGKIGMRRPRWPIKTF